MRLRAVMLTTLHWRQEEEHVLRCPGGGVDHAVKNLAFEAPRGAFDNAGTMGELLDAGALRGKIARFLHKHEDGKG